jgi:hypothetical protein
MLLAKKIRSLLNGGGTVAGIRGLREAIGQIEAEMEAHRIELAEIPGRRNDAAFADDAEKERAALSAREEHLCAALDVAEIRIGRLRERLEELTAADREAELGKRREAILVAADNFVTALRATYSTFAELSKLRDEASAAGFRLDVQHIPIAPGLLNLTNPTGDQWPVENFAMLIEQYRKTASPVPLKPMAFADAPRPYNMVMPTSFGGVDPRIEAEVGHGVGHGRVALRQMPTPASSAVSPRGKAQPEQPARKARPPIVLAGPPAQGMVRCVVLKGGYPDAEGRQLARGDQVDVAEEKVTSAIAHTAVERLDLGSEEANP